MVDHQRLRELLETPVYDVRYAVWYSSTEANPTFTQDYVPNQPNGYFAANPNYSPAPTASEWGALGQMPTAPGSSQLQVTPYPTRLRPVSNLNFFGQATKVVLTRLHFRAYDHRDPSSPAQDVATNAAMDASLLTNHAFVSARFMDAVIGDWSVNFFRPEFWLGGVNILRDLSSAEIGQRDAYGNMVTQNVADLSIGLPLPFECQDIYAVIGGNTGQIPTLRPQVFAQCVQYVPATGRYVRYPVKCVAEFVVSSDRRSHRG